MWKPSAISVVGSKSDSKSGSSGANRSGSFLQRNKNGRSGPIGQPDQDSIRQLWEIALEGVESSAWEDINEELSASSRRSFSSNTSSSSSSSSSSSPIARQGGKLLQAVKRKVNLSSSTKKTSPIDRFSVQDAKDSSRSRNSCTQDGETVSDNLLEELETLRQKLEMKEKEMLKLKNEVSTLRITTTISSVQPQSQSQAEAEASPQQETSRRDSFDSVSSQLSCLDFSHPPSTGNLKFEGKIKTKITSSSTHHVESGHQPDSILPNSAAVGAPRLVETLPAVNEGFAPEDLILSTIKGQDHTGGGLKLPDKTVEELHISTQNYVYKTEDEFFDIHAKESRSPPKSYNSGTEEDAFELPMMVSDSSNSFVLHKATSSKVTDGVSSARSSCELSDVEVDGNSRLTMMKDGEEIDANAVTVPRNDQLTSKSSPGKEYPSKVLMTSCDMLEVDKLSRTMSSLHQEESFSTAMHLDVISRPRSVRSAPVAAQAYRSARLKALDCEATAGNSVDQLKTEASSCPSSSRIEMELGSKFLTMSTSEGSMEPISSSNCIDFDNLSAPKSLRRSSYGSTGRQAREHATTTGDRREGLSLVSPSTFLKATMTTAFRHEGPSPTSPSTSPRGRGLPPSSFSAGWKPKFGSLEEIDLEVEVRQILEQSRLLLLSDESDNEGHECNVPPPVSEEKPFSVLALSRQRRSTEKSRTSPRHRPEINQQQERPAQQQDQAIVLYGDNDAWNVQSSKTEIFSELDAEQESEDHSPSRPSELRNAVQAPKKEDLELVWELEVRNSMNQIEASLPRRSRFFFEANAARTPEVV